jgi:hypothetical protein
LDTRLVAIGVAAAENGDHVSNSSNSNDDYSDENNPPTGGSGNGSYGGVLFYQVAVFGCIFIGGNACDSIIWRKCPP